MKKYFALVLLAVMVIFGIYLSFKNKAQAPSEKPINEIQTPLVTTPATQCHLTVGSPLPNTSITFPLTLTATRGDVTEVMGCKWGIFEAVGGTVKVTDPSNTIVSQTILNATTDWMTTNPVTLVANLPTPASPIPSGTPLTITLTADQTKDDDPTVTLTIPVVMQ